MYSRIGSGISIGRGGTRFKQEKSESSSSTSFSNELAPLAQAKGQRPRQPISFSTPSTPSTPAMKGASPLQQSQLPGHASASAAVATRMTPETLEHAIREVPKWKDAQSLANGIVAYISEQLAEARAAGKTPLILVGERHKSPASLMALMSVMKAVHQQHGEGAVFMPEQPTNEMARVSPKFISEFDSVMPKGTGETAIKNADGMISPLFQSAQKDTWLTGAKIYTASRLGFELAGCDPVHDPAFEREPERELAMANAIRDRIDGRNTPVIVQLGRYHLPQVREHLASQAHVISLAGVEPEMALHLKFTAESEGKEKLGQRYGGLVLHPEVKPFQVSDSLEKEPLQYLKFAQQLGIDLSVAG